MPLAYRFLMIGLSYSNSSCVASLSFNLARVRTKCETQEAGWERSNGLYYNDMEDPASVLCSNMPEQSGCENVPVEGGGAFPEEEHIAGPGCVYTGGYSGYRITPEDMKNMRLTRYIIPKPKNTVDEEDAPDYEKCSDYFISDQSITTQDHFTAGRLPRVRYGVGHFFPQNNEVVAAGVEMAVPVHDACWKMFEHISKSRFGNVDLQGFMALWWYLAANPYEIPGFALIMQEEYHECASENALAKYNQSISQQAKERPEPKYWVNCTDPFMKLSAELKTMLLMELDSKSIRNLRLVSRAFRQLPQHVYKHLILKELPWFWEIDEIQPQKQEHIRNTYIRMYGEDLSKLGDTFEARYKQRVKDTIERKRSPETLDWRNVYQTLKMLERGRLGVKNRVRIWGLLEDIVGRIERLRNTPEAHKRYELRGEGEDLLHVQPTEEEKEKGMVTHAFYCKRCQGGRIERMVEEEKMDEDNN
ncbi:F-box-like domain-containing protein [Rutstroemia sp. NJR-2017a BVV2]|nr:F-box-like domain-containing protein [Rutstroemia sp. NJR-2017a BVV2]